MPRSTRLPVDLLLRQANEVVHVLQPIALDVEGMPAKRAP